MREGAKTKRNEQKCCRFPTRGSNLNSLVVWQASASRSLPRFSTPCLCSILHSLKENIGLLVIFCYILLDLAGLGLYNKKT